MFSKLAKNAFSVAQRSVHSSASVCKGNEVLEVSQASAQAFMNKFREYAPPQVGDIGTLAEGLKKVDEEEATPSGVATLNFYVPHEVLASGVKVDIVEIPTASGYFGVKAGHVPTIAQLAPGVVTIHPAAGGDAKDAGLKKYFVSSGFAFSQGSSVDICAVEAVPLDAIDPEAIREGLKAAQDKLAAKADDYEAAVAQAQIDTFQAMARAVGA